MRTTNRSYRPSRAGDLVGFTRSGRPLYLPGGGSPDAVPPADTDKYVFPFAVPADLSTASDEELRTILGQVREHSQGFSRLSPAEHTTDSVRALGACRDLARDVAATITTRRENAATAASASGDLDAAFSVLDETDPAPEPEPQPDPEPAPTEPAPEPQPTDPAPAPGEPQSVTAARRSPSVRTVANRAPAPQVPDNTVQPYAVMTAAADVPGFASGQRLDRFAQAADAISARLDRYPTMSAGSQRYRGDMNRRPVDVYDPDSPARRFEINSFSRHGAVQIRREFPSDLRIADGGNAESVLDYAASTRRLPGGSLIASAQQAAKSGRALTAAAGWCAPSEVMYDLLELETMDGMLDLPEVQASRGGFQIPDNGGPDFSTIWGGIGNSGVTHLSEPQVIAESPGKVCYEIPCPTFSDVRLGVDYVCLTGGLLQRRGYPEVVGRFTRGATTALAHKINMGVIAAIQSGSGSAITIPADANGDDAISSLLSGVELAITDMKYRTRMGFNQTMEVVLPMWVLTQMRAAATRRRGVNMVSLADAEILAWFTQRDAVPRFVYDWQDQYSGGGNTTPGGATALTALPTSVTFLVYPAGTWVKAVQDVVNLDTIYDSTKLVTNEYTALFAEDGWAVMKMGPVSRRYVVNLDPSGVTGCCNAEVS